MDSIKVYVASASNSRKKLAKENDLDWIFVNNEFDEDKIKNAFNVSNFKSVLEYTKILSRGKAESVKDKYSGIIIGCDSVVYQKGKILEKPKNENEFYKMMEDITRNIHYLVTGVTIINNLNNKIIQFTEITKLFFDKFTQEQKLFLLKECNGLSNAGGYTLCEKIDANTHIIKGDRNNVIGLPIKRIQNEIINIL